MIVPLGGCHLQWVFALCLWHLICLHQIFLFLLGDWWVTESGCSCFPCQYKCHSNTFRMSRFKFITHKTTILTFDWQLFGSLCNFLDSNSPSTSFSFFILVIFHLKNANRRLRLQSFELDQSGSSSLSKPPSIDKECKVGIWIMYSS